MPTAPRRASRSRLLIALLSLETAFAGIPQAAAADSPRPAFEIMELRAPESAREIPGTTAQRRTREAGRAPGQSDAPGAASADALDQEPNETPATATPLTGANVVVRANIFPAGDLDFYSFPATAGDRVYAAVQTLFDAQINSGDSVLDLLGTDGTTVIESDNNDGTLNGNASSLAGVLIPSTGTFFLRVRHNVAGFTLRPYDLHFKLQTGAPTAEVEPNNSLAAANPLPASGWVSGTLTAVSPGEFDLFSLALSAGDSVYLSLDMNPERDANVWNGRLGFGLFGNPPANQVLLANDANAGASPADPNSEAFFFTVLTAGTYYVYLDSIVAAGLGANATYNLSVAVHPAPVAAGTCTTYTSTNVPQTIPAGPGSVSSTLTIPGNPRIADLDVSLNLNHTFMQDVDVHLISPAGNDNGLFTDIGATSSTQSLMDLRIDDEAALPPAFALSASMVVQPEAFYRLSWFDGEDAGGTWTLQIRDDLSGDGGTLNSWGLTVCEPPPPPSCAAGFVPQTVFTADFESGDAGFTHSGVQDEWERGLPSFAPITTCNSGTNCWKTDLDSTYELLNSQDLVSPNIDLTGLSAPVVVSWAQRYQLGSAPSVDAFVDHQQVGGATPVRLFQWLDAAMTDSVGNPSVTIAASSGWSTFSERADSLAGQNTELRFHLAANTNGTLLAGWALDDVSVTACRPVSADLAITKTDGVATAVPGGSVAYTITASNLGGDVAAGATVADTFPAPLACTWTCAGAGGGTCAAAGTGSINDPVNLPLGGSVTYMAACTIAPSATGSLVNTATVASSVFDPNPANNSATDTDTLSPQADLKVTKTDGQTTVRVGEPITYTIVASNAGPSSSPGATVTDAVPAALTGAAWTCTGAGGGACTAAGSGSINDVVDLPAGGSVTYTLTATVVDLASGSLANTATVAAPSGVLDPNPGDNSATDTDTGAAVGDFFYSIDPCRILDTRGGAPIGGPAMTGEETRTFAVAGTCGVPATAKALVVNVTVTQATAGGHVTLFAAGQPTPAVSNINYSPAQTRANSAVVALSAAGALNAFVGQPAGTSVHVIIDVSGYFE